MSIRLPQIRDDNPMIAVQQIASEKVRLLALGLAYARLASLYIESSQKMGELEDIEIQRFWNLVMGSLDAVRAGKADLLAALETIANYKVPGTKTPEEHREQVGGIAFDFQRIAKAAIPAIGKERRNKAGFQARNI